MSSGRPRLPEGILMLARVLRQRSTGDSPARKLDDALRASFPKTERRRGAACR